MCAAERRSTVPAGRAGNEGAGQASTEDVGEHVARRWPLPEVDESTSKLGRGTVLIIGGTVETPGSVLLAGVAALRAGAGRLQIATAAPAAPALAAAVPEARVMGLATSDAEIRPDAIHDIADAIAGADAVLVGPGSLDPDRAALASSYVLEHLGPESTFVLDAGALALLTRMPDQFAPIAGRAVLMPNPTEAAHLLTLDPAQVESQPVEVVSCLVDRFGAASALRMDCTYVAAPGTPVYRDDCGHPALATSGSGDVLAGIIVGLLAQGTAPLSALIRATHAHGLAGHMVAERAGGYGILARELLDEIPRALRRA